MKAKMKEIEKQKKKDLIKEKDYTPMSEPEYSPLTETNNPMQSKSDYSPMLEPEYISLFDFEPEYTPSTPVSEAYYAPSSKSESERILMTDAKVDYEFSLYSNPNKYDDSSMSDREDVENYLKYL